MSKIEVQNLTVDYTEKNNRFTALKDILLSSMGELYIKEIDRYLKDHAAGL